MHRLIISLQISAVTGTGGTDEAMSDPEYLTLVLDSFNADELEFMPGRDVLILNDNFTGGVYNALYYMLGFPNVE